MAEQLRRSALPYRVDPAAGIDSRTGQSVEAILAIWPVPPGHKVRVGREQADAHITVEIADLIGAGYLAAGQAFFSSPGKSGGFSGRVLSDGRIEVEGQVFDNPSSAGSFVSKKSTNGWNFWRLEPDGRRPLKDVRTEYLKVVSPEEADEDDANPSGRGQQRKPPMITCRRLSR